MLIFVVEIKRQKIMHKEMIEEFVKSAENAAYAIVCKMIDAGFVESEPEGLALEHEFTKIIRNKFGF